MKLVAYVRRFRERWVTISFCFLLGVNVAIAVDVFTPTVYSASTSLFLEVGAPTRSLYDASQFSVQRVKSYPSLVDSPNVLKPVIKELHLDMSPSQLAELVSATSPTDTASLRVTAHSSDPNVVAEIANAVSAQLTEEVASLERVAGGRSSTVGLRLTVPAYPPSFPQSPNGIVYVALGGLGGLGTGLMLAILVSNVDNRIRTADDIRRASRLPLIAQLPQGRRGWRGLLDRATEEDAATANDEAFDNLRRLSGGRIPQLLILSPASDHGRFAFLRIDLAQAAAAKGRRVCLIEADEREHESLPFPPEAATNGLSDVLAGRCDLQDALLRTTNPLVSILLAGTSPNPQPCGTSAPAIRAVLERLRTAYDVCILQTATRAHPADLDAVAPGADAVVILAEYGRTRQDEIARFAARLQTRRIQPIGVILTSVPRRSRAAMGDHSVPEGA